MKRTPSGTATAAVPGDGPKKVFVSTCFLFFRVRGVGRISVACVRGSD